MSVPSKLKWLLFYVEFSPGGRTLHTQPAGPKVTLRFPHLYAYIFVHPYLSHAQ